MNKTEVMIIGLLIAFIILFIRLVILKYEFKLWNKYIMIQSIIYHYLYYHL